MKKGFSLAELMIVLVVAGVIAAMTVPTLVSNFSAVNKALYRTAVKIAESTVNDLISNTTLYPTVLNSTLCNNFKSKINTITVNSCTTSTLPVSSSDNGTPNFATTNGMRWYKFENTFSTSNCPSGFSGNCMVISVDVNGTSKPNSTTGTNKDILQIIISNDGRVTIPAGGVEADYLSN